MPDNLKLNVKIDADIKRFKAALEAVKKALNALRGVVDDAGEAIDGMGKEVDDLGGKLDKIDGKGRIPGIGGDAETAGKKVRGLNSSLGTLARRLGAVVAGYLGFQAAKALSRQIDAYTELNNRIRLVADSERELVGIRDQLFAISLRTRSSLSVNAQLYSRLAQASKDLGTSQADLLKVTEILNKQVLIGGSNASEARAGLIQFAQGIASGKLQGDELRSVLENLLGVQQGLIDGFKILREEGTIAIDINRSNLRKLASEGVLTPELLLKALLAAADKTEERFEKVAVTIGGAFQNLFTAIFGQLGLLDERTNASQYIASRVNAGAEVIRPATETEKELERIHEQFRRRQVAPQHLSLKALEGLAERTRGELQSESEYQARPGSYYGGGAEKIARRGRIRELEEEVALYEKLARQKTKQIGLNAKVEEARYKAYELPPAVAAINARLLSPEERLRAQHKADSEALKKTRQDLREEVNNYELRLNKLRQADAASQLAGLRQEIETEEKNLQSRRDKLDRVNKNLALLDEELDRNLANTPAAREKRAEQERQAAEAAAKAREKEREEAAKARQEERKRLQELKEQAKARVDAIASIGKERLKLLNSFERERAALRKWAQETRETLRMNAADYAQHAAQLDDVFRKRLADIDKRELDDRREQIEQRLRNSRVAVDGLLRGLEDYARSATNAAEQVEETVEDAFKNIEDQLVRLVTRGKFSVKQFLRELAEDTARATIRIGVTGPIAASLGARLRGALPGLPAPTSPTKDAVDQMNTDLKAKQDQIINAGRQINTAAKHQLSEAQQHTALLKRIADCSCGGDARLAQFQQFRVGGDGGRRLLETILSTTLSRVPRFHRGGVVPGRPGQEVLTLLEGGEAVLPRAALAARTAGGGPPQQVQVIVENRGATQQEVVEQRAEASGERLIINVALEDIMRRGPFSQGFERAYGLTRRTG